jgi:hypothetical protein
MRRAQPFSLLSIHRQPLLMTTSWTESIRLARRRQSEFAPSCSMSDAHVNFIRTIAKSRGFVRKASAPLASALRLVSASPAIGGDHDHRYFRSSSLRLGQKIKAAHPRHVDIGQDQDERSISVALSDALKRVKPTRCERDDTARLGPYTDCFLDLPR